MNVESATPLATGSGTLCDDERAAAAQRIAHRRHRAFWIYAGALGAANALVVAFWVVLATVGRLDVVTISIWPGQPPLPKGFFWPIIPIAVCGYLVFMSARRAYPSDGYPDEVLDEEVARYRASHSSGGDNPIPAKSSTNNGRHAPAARPAPSTRRGTAGAKERRRGFAVHVGVYVAINTVLVAAWALGGGGFFWPVFLMTAWGVGVLVNGYMAFRPRP